MDATALLAEHENASRFDALVAALSAGKLNLFVGAGMSIPCGMRGWTDFLLSRSGTLRPRVGALLAEERHEAAAQLLWSTLGCRSFEEALQQEFGPACVPFERIRGAVRLIPDLVELSRSNLILTTNFDRVIEAAFGIRNMPLSQPILGGHPELLRSFRDAPSPHLFKIHGDVLDPIGRILTADEYASAYGDRRERRFSEKSTLPNILGMTFVQKSVLFVGCSLARDRTMAVLRANARRRPAAPFHFAILENGCSEEAQRRERDQALLNQHKIKAIWYPAGRHEAVEALLALLYRRVARHRARGLRPPGARFAFDLEVATDPLSRDRLCEADFTSGAAIPRPELEAVLSALLEDGRPRPGRHVAISGPPGTGKSALAAWIDFSLAERGEAAAYFPGKEYQGGSDLRDGLSGLPRGFVAIVDDVHLLRRHAQFIKEQAHLSLVLLGRSGVFDDWRRDDALPAVTRFELTREGARSVAEGMAAHHERTPVADALRNQTDGDLALTKFALWARRSVSGDGEVSLRDMAGVELKRIHRGFANSDPGSATEMLRAFAIVTCFAGLELVPKHSDLEDVFGIAGDHLRALVDPWREATSIDDDRLILLDRHASLALLLANAVDATGSRGREARSRTMRRLGLTDEAGDGGSFLSTVLGAIAGKALVLASDLVDRLVYGDVEVDLAHLGKVAAAIEAGAAKPPLALADRERRLVLAYALANGMRRRRGGGAAVKLLAGLRRDLAVEDVPREPFPEKGYVLYQQAFLEWLTNAPERAITLLAESADAEEAIAGQSQGDMATMARFRAKAAMSRIAGARLSVEASAMASAARVPQPEPAVASAAAETLRSAIDTLRSLARHVRDGERRSVDRYVQTALLHLAQVLAWQGDETAMVATIAAAAEIVTRRDRDRDLLAQSARGTLHLVQGQFRQAAPILEDTARIMWTDKAGESSGLHAQLAASAWRAVGENERFVDRCRWLIDACPVDAGNGAAIGWAHSALSKE